MQTPVRNVCWGDKTEYQVLIGLGEPFYREQIRRKLENDQIEMTSFISKYSFVSEDCRLGKGIIIFPNVYIAHEREIEDSVVVRANAKITDGVKIGRDSFISLGAFVGSKAMIGSVCFIGPNATVRDQVVIEDWSVIGMACCMPRSLPTGRYIGNPARVLATDKRKVWGQENVIDSEER